MKIDILTLFPEICRAPLEQSMMKRARESAAVEIQIHNLRDWTKDKHHVVDDAPFGGGVRNAESAERMFDMGVERVVVGTAAALVVPS